MAANKEESLDGSLGIAILAAVPDDPQMPRALAHPSPDARAGFALAEFLVVAFLLGVGLLGLVALQVAAVRAGAGAAARAAALALAEGALETALAQARHPEPPALLGAGEPPPRGFGLDGLPAGCRPAFFTLGVGHREAGPGIWEARATVTWTEGAGPARRTLTLSRLVAR